MTSLVLLLDPVAADSDTSDTALAATLSFVPSAEPILSAFDGA